ncbi:MAG TPA: hypothetical protein P5052_03180 [Candidatus Paceibacterota bacterium]|nr:hypothetical protein [Candidatus Paceibacterota bacterium]
MCKSEYELGTQVQLTYKGSKITKDNITDITGLKFNVKLTGNKCTADLLKRFQNSFVNVKVDNTVIKTIEIPHNTREANFTFEDVFGLLPITTQNNILNTFYKPHPVTGGPIEAAKVNFYFET